MVALLAVTLWTGLEYSGDGESESMHFHIHFAPIVSVEFGGFESDVFAFSEAHLPVAEFAVLSLESSSGVKGTGRVAAVTGRGRFRRGSSAAIAKNKSDLRDGVEPTDAQRWIGEIST